MYKVFIDGQVGTTGLQIYERLKNRSDIELLEIPESDRKNLEKKKEFLNQSDLVILCLPDSAAKESVSLIDNPNVKVLDASTAHRIAEDWTYGLAELPEQREKIENARFVSNPGCYPTGFLLAVRPLVAEGILNPESLVTVNAVSGYSGGGRQLIEIYEKHAQQVNNPSDLWNYRPYALGLEHKHAPEMKKYALLENQPLFVPSVGHFAQGMLVSIPLFTKQFQKEVGKEEIHQILSKSYENEPFVQIMPLEGDYLESGFLNPQDCNQTNRVDIFIFGNQDQILLVSRLDNLGKGASGAAVQNMNLMLGLKEGLGLQE
ncbi:MAG: N-acetyl-gamma-glutamyl-phosphate reductase [bacterium]|jgi:N-acetyl-gamma-glutamyl-phosphate reductase